MNLDFIRLSESRNQSGLSRVCEREFRRVSGKFCQVLANCHVLAGLLTVSLTVAIPPCVSSSPFSTCRWRRGSESATLASRLGFMTDVFTKDVGRTVKICPRATLELFCWHFTGTFRSAFSRCPATSLHAGG